jgi:hypothetical protein
MARILVSAKEAVIGLETGKAHSYLVFEDHAGARFVTSLTDVRSEAFPPSLRFDVEQIGTPYDQAEETDDPNRVERPLDLGERDAGAVWELITQHAGTIRDEAPVYNPLTQNSNSFVASLLNVVGIDLDRNLPGFDGRNPTSDPEPGRLSRPAQPPGLRLRADRHGRGRHHPRRRGGRPALGRGRRRHAGRQGGLGRARGRPRVRHVRLDRRGRGP